MSITKFAAFLAVFVCLIALSHSLYVYDDDDPDNPKLMRFHRFPIPWINEYDPPETSTQYDSAALSCRESFRSNYSCMIEVVMAMRYSQDSIVASCCSTARSLPEDCKSFLTNKLKTPVPDICFEN
ncbi:hypothetical protein ACFE04_016914 [Oxalis oulophora]